MPLLQTSQQEKVRENLRQEEGEKEIVSGLVGLPLAKKLLYRLPILPLYSLHISRLVLFTTSDEPR